MKRTWALISFFLALFVAQTLFLAAHESRHFAEEQRSARATLHAKDCPACEAFQARIDVPALPADSTPQTLAQLASSDEKLTIHSAPVLYSGSPRSPPVGA